VDAQRWLDELREELARHKLPRRYSKRLVLKLSDHLTDFMEDHMSMDAVDLRDAVRPMGLPSQIAAVAACEFRKQRFSGRHPLLTFAALPVITLLGFWIGGLLALIGAGAAIAKLFGHEAGPDPTQIPSSLETILPWIGRAYILVPLVLSAAYFCRLARKAAVGWRWPMLACLLLALVGSMAIAEVSAPTPGQRGHFMVGFRFSRKPRSAQFVQFAVPLAIGAFAAWRQTSQRRGSLAA
jgi:hypothetical protein